MCRHKIGNLRVLGNLTLIMLANRLTSTKKRILKKASHKLKLRKKQKGTLNRNKGSKTDKALPSTASRSTPPAFVKPLKRLNIVLGILTFIILMLAPYLFWLSQSYTAMDILILDKSVAQPDYREHKGFMWLVNHFKFHHEADPPYDYATDYVGYKPQPDGQDVVSELPRLDSAYDLIYLIDAKGVYAENRYQGEVVEQHATSELLYGGITLKELDTIQGLLRNNATLISEASSLSRPTSTAARHKLEEMMGIFWSGWVGKFHINLSESEVDDWLVSMYEAEHQEPWRFRGAGLVLVNTANDEERILVMKMGKDLKGPGFKMSFAKSRQDHYRVKEKKFYLGWFDIVMADYETKTEAYYEIYTTEVGKEKLDDHAIPIRFPAVVKHEASDYTSYYLAGDFADVAKVPAFHQFKGLSRFMGQTRASSSQNGFFWQVYSPMIERILRDTSETKENTRFLDLLELSSNY